MREARNEDYDAMTLEEVIESQRRDMATDFQPPEHGGVSPFENIALLDRWLDPDADESIMQSRTPAERRPNINGIPGVYDTIDPWTYKLRFGHTTRGCRTHGTEHWRTTNMQTGEPLFQAYCAECKRERRARG